MKKLTIIETKNYFGNTVYKYGYWKQSTIVQGWDSFGPVAEICKNMKEAKKLIAEWTYEDSCARLIAKPGKMFIEIDKESMFNKRMARKELKNSKPQKKYKCLYYGWDGSIIDKFSSENPEEFQDLIKYMIAGDKIAWKDKYENLHIVKCEYKNPENILKGKIELCYYSTTNGLPDIVEW